MLGIVHISLLTRTKWGSEVPEQKVTLNHTLLQHDNPHLHDSINPFEGNIYSVQFSHSVMSDSLRPHGLQHARPPCPAPTPRVYPKSCPLSRWWWCHPTISSLSSSSPPAFNFSQHQGLSSESVLHIRWSKYWSFSFSISPFNEHSGLISFRMDWLDLLAVQGTLKSLLQRPV